MTEDLKPNPMDGAEKNWWGKLPTWAKWAIGVVGAFVLIGIGVAIGGGDEEDSLKKEVASLESQVEAAESKTEAAEEKAEASAERADKIEGEADSITERAEEEAAKIKGKAGKEAASLEGQVAELKDEVKSAESDLAEVNSELGGAEEKVAKGKITDGTWQLDRDYLPGTYESPGGGGCYWALLSSPGGELEDIIENGGFNKHQILTIESPYFETRGCGTWRLAE